MKKHRILIICVSLIVVAAIASILLAHDSHHDENKPFDAKETIFEHLVDHYSWEVPFSHSHKIPLPIIVRDNAGSWHIFSSNRIEHGESYEGFFIDTTDEYHGKVVAKDENGALYRPVDLSLTKNAAALIISALVVCLCLFPLVRWYKKNGNKAPRGFIGAIEMLTMMIYDEVIKSILGEKNGRRFAPYLLTAFYFIFIMNLLGLMVIFPAGANLTGNIAITLVLALCTFLAVNIFGTKEYWKEIFWPEVPILLKAPLPIMPFIELFGLFTKPIALMVRLFANMMGGHMIVLVLLSLIFIFSELGGALIGGGTSILSVGFSLFMYIIDTLVSYIQAYVFTMLSTIFISLAQVEGHHHKESEKAE